MKLEGFSYIIVIHIDWHVHRGLRRKLPIAFVEIEHCIVFGAKLGIGKDCYKPACFDWLRMDTL